MAYSKLLGTVGIAGLAVIAVVVILLFPAAAAQAQTYTVLHNFAGNDGSGPVVGLTSRDGNLYGTTNLGGTGQWGTAFEMVRNASNWILKPLYDFSNGVEGGFPGSRVVFGPDGNLYGSTDGGGQHNKGVIYKLQPPVSGCQRALCPWVETVLYNFTGLSDGSSPQGDLVFDQAGNLYGTAGGGTGSCQGGCGVVFQLSPSQGSWTYTVLYTFTSLSDGALPESGVILDQSGNLYGATNAGGTQFMGTVFELTKTGATWTKSVLHTLQGGSDGQFPQGVVFDPAGNLYGFTEFGGDHNNGTAFELQPSGGGWNYRVIFSFGQEIASPVATPLLDGAGNIYGSAFGGGSHFPGGVFKLAFSGGSWSYVPLHYFTGLDGQYPLGGVIFDAEGNLYGTASGGGTFGGGVVFEITP